MRRPAPRPGGDRAQAIGPGQACNFIFDVAAAWRPGHRRCPPALGAGGGPCSAVGIGARTTGPAAAGRGWPAGACVLLPRPLGAGSGGRPCGAAAGAVGAQMPPGGGGRRATGPASRRAPERRCSWERAPANERQRRLPSKPSHAATAMAVVRTARKLNWWRQPPSRVAHSAQSRRERETGWKRKRGGGERESLEVERGSEGATERRSEGAAARARDTGPGSGGERAGRSPPVPGPGSVGSGPGSGARIGPIRTPGRPGRTFAPVIAAGWGHRAVAAWRRRRRRRIPGTERGEAWVAASLTGPSGRGIRFGPGCTGVWAGAGGVAVIRLGRARADPGPHGPGTDWLLRVRATRSAGRSLS